MKKVLSLFLLLVLVLSAAPTVYADSYCEEHGHVPDALNNHKCEVCGTVFDDCFDKDGNNICDMCGKVICCLNDYLIWVSDGSVCRQLCKKCGKIHIEQAHCYDSTIGTACFNCGAECSHANIGWETTPEEHFGRCMDCWTVIAELGSHSIVDGVCTVCGYGGCDHKTDGKYDMTSNNFGHDLSCTLCGEIIVPWSPHEYDAEGTCTVCGFAGCPHGTLEEAESVTAYFNATEHWYVCNLCEYAYSDNESHSFENGVCTVCGAKPCATLEHNIVCSICRQRACVCDDDVISTQLRLHVCSVCNIIAGCQDNNGDCLCDYCMTEHHNFLYEMTETEHRVVCRCCGYISDWEAHFDIDAFIGCDFCAYGKPQAQTKVENEEGMFNTTVELPIGTILSEEEKRLIADGTNVDIVVHISVIDETVGEEDKISVGTVIQKNDTEQTVAVFLNIDLSKTVGNGEALILSETGAPVSITMDIPEEFQTDNRRFSVIRVHDGITTELPDLDNNPKTVTIETDRFSTYALVYTDKQVVDNSSENSVNFDNDTKEFPTTVIVVVVILIVVITVPVATAVIKKKRIKEKE